MRGGCRFPSSPAEPTFSALVPNVQPSEFKPNCFGLSSDCPVAQSNLRPTRNHKAPRFLDLLPLFSVFRFLSFAFFLSFLFGLPFLVRLERR